jgi:metal-sulfur cluster biosynthetic enzyme
VPYRKRIAMGNIAKEHVIDRLKEVFDPEVPVDIWNFGLIYDVAVSEGDEVKILMTLTSETCPSAKQIPDDVRKKVMALDGVKSCDVEVVFEPRWSPHRITEEGRAVLGMDDE